MKIHSHVEHNNVYSRNSQAMVPRFGFPHMCRSCYMSHIGGHVMSLPNRGEGKAVVLSEVSILPNSHSH